MDNPNLEYYEELIHAEDAIQFDGLDYAIVGVSHDGYYIYDYDRMIECFIEESTPVKDLSLCIATREYEQVRDNLQTR